MDSVGNSASLLARCRVARVVVELGVVGDSLEGDVGDAFEGDVGDAFVPFAAAAVTGDKEEEAGEVGDVDCAFFPVTGNALIDNEDVGGRLRGVWAVSFEGGITTGVPGTNVPNGLFPNAAPVIAGDTGADSVVNVGRAISTTDGSRS